MCFAYWKRKWENWNWEQMISVGIWKPGTKIVFLLSDMSRVSAIFMTRESRSLTYRRATSCLQRTSSEKRVRHKCYLEFALLAIRGSVQGIFSHHLIFHFLVLFSVLSVLIFIHYITLDNKYLPARRNGTSPSIFYQKKTKKEKRTEQTSWKRKKYERRERKKQLRRPGIP